ncbi:MAG: class I SAM-dependent methyltransferase [Planctomycetes bacterium]|nr:class I SAM-dependent methyltransferase [Planctomycetota bacterium]
MRSPACVACGTATNQGDRWFDHLWRCRHCTLVFADLEAYPDTDRQYRESFFRGDAYRDYVDDRETLQRNLRRHLARIRQYRPSGRMFEIGCAYGFFLDLAKEFWQVEGIDISATAADYARRILGVDAFSGDFLAHPIEAGTIDVFCLWDTLEHLRRPDLYVEKMARCLRPAGIVCLTTGDVRSLNARFRGRKWRLIIPPTHLYYFSRNSLAALFARYGMTLVSSRYVGYHRRVSSMIHQIPGLSRLSADNVHFRRLTEAVGKRDLYVNLFDILFVVAMKPAERQLLGRGTPR